MNFIALLSLCTDVCYYPQIADPCEPSGKCEKHFISKNFSGSEPGHIL